ncbi:MAG: sigma-70 family RNA polymerase sigma factor [Planctomycetes bacterium]|nr:sigma-70 family RNA polymerase sigma factor [Planctomycetota bacterium]
MSRSDADLAMADFARTGDPAAMARLFDVAAPKLLLVASHWTSDPAEAEDLVQLTFIHAARDAAGYDPRRRVLPWLAGILAHRALERRRSNARVGQGRIDPDRLDSPSRSPLGTAIDRELVEHIDAALDGMPEPYRQVLVLRVSHGLEPAAIAHALGRPPATVRKQLERGLQRLRGLLPASITGALAGLLLAGRGLAAVRRAVLDELTVPAPLPTTALGGLLVNKLLAVVAAAALATWLLWPAEIAPPATIPDAGDLAAPAPATAALDVTAAADVAATPAPGRTAAGPAVGSLRVTAVDTTRHQPAANVRLALLPRDGTDESLTTCIAATAADGSHVFAALRPGDYAVAFGPGKAVDAVVRAGTETAVTIEVAGGPIARGTVVAPDGTPIADAEVWQYPSYGRPGRERPHPAARTDREGRFELATDVPQLNLSARHPDHAESPLLSAYVTEESAPLCLRLRPAPARLELTVTLAAEPLSDAVVELHRTGGTSVRGDHGTESDFSDRFAATDADGRCVLACLMPGGATLVVHAHGAVPEARELELAAGGRTATTLDLLPSPRLSGTVTDDGGVPLADIRVSCSFLGIVASATTTADGSYELDSLRLGTAVVTAAADDEHGSRRRQVELRAGEPQSCDFVLDRLPTLAGRVVDAAGRPLPGFAVVANRSDVGRNTIAPVFSSDGRVDFHSQRKTRTDADGRFELRVTPEVDYIVDLSEPGQWLAVLGERFGPLRAPRNDVVLTVRPEELATAFVTGRVLDGEGRPVAGAVFRIGDGTRLAVVGRNAPGTARSGADGSFRIGPLPAREYELQIHPFGERIAPWESGPLRLAIADTLALGDIVLETPATVELAVREPSGAPAHGVLAQFERDGKTEIDGFTAAGTLRHALAPGTWLVTVYGDGYSSRSRELTIAPGAVTHADFTMDRGMRFALDLTLPAGETGGVLEIRGPGGEIDFRTELEREDEFSTRWEPALIAGNNTASLRCGAGHRYEASFVVAEQPHAAGEKPDAFVPDWRRLP